MFMCRCMQLVGSSLLSSASRAITPPAQSLSAAIEMRYWRSGCPLLCVPAVSIRSCLSERPTRVTQVGSSFASKVIASLTVGARLVGL